MGYITKQKQTVYLFLEANKERHLTADEVIFGLVKEGNAVSKSTVYRYLDALEKEGKIIRYNIDSKSGACYQLSESCCEKEHFHLKCFSCGSLFHVECHKLSDIENHILNDHSFEIDYSKTVLYGKCKDCLKKEAKK